MDVGARDREYEHAGRAAGAAFWEKGLGLTATGRNWNTVTKLRELADS